MRLLLLLFICFVCFGTSAQEKEYVSAFKNKQLINAQTTVIPEGFDFTIMHRFGKVALDERLYKDFLGFDSPANIRFSLSYKLNGRSYIGVGRTKMGKTYDVEAKYVVLKQTANNSMPISLAIFHNAGVNTEESPNYGPNAFFSDSITPFEAKFAHRLDYTTELIISRQFNDVLSLQISPTLVYKNLVIGLEEDHVTFALPFSGRIQYSFSSAILFEYAYKLNNRSDFRLDNPFSIGFEFGTAGHVFQLFMSNSYYLRESAIYTMEPYDLYESPYEFILGFNIRRVWWF